MSASGQSRHFDPASPISGLPRIADILRIIRHVPKGPMGDIGSIYSITSSAATSKVCGTVRPSAFAVFMLMTKSNFVG